MATGERPSDDVTRPDEEPLKPEPPLDAEHDPHDEEEDLRVSGLSAFLHDRRKVSTSVLVFLAAVVGIYLVFPKVLGIDESLERLGKATWYWIAIAVAFNVAAFAAYVALFRGVLGGPVEDDVRRRLDLRASYQITMAGLAATRIFSAAGAQ